MEKKSQIEAILKQRFFVTPTGYPSQNGFLDYGPVLAQIKLEMLEEFRKLFKTEGVYELEPSAVVPYEVLKASGHVDKFCDIIISDGESVFRADHFLEERIDTFINIPCNLKDNYSYTVEKIEALKNKLLAKKYKKTSCKTLEEKIAQFDLRQCTHQLTSEEAEMMLSEFECSVKPLADLTKQEIDFVIILYNIYSPANKPFNPASDFNLIFKLNEKQFLRPEIAQSQFTNFRKIFELNNEKLPFASMAIGRSYRNEISARGGMLRTKEFEQAEIEYFSENGMHADFESVKDVEVSIFPNKNSAPFKTTLEKANRDGVIRSEAICYYIAKAQEFLLSIGFKLSSIRYRQHNINEMAHYANDCWDVEIKTLSGWVECAGIADRAKYDLTCHSGEINVNVKKYITPKKVYEIVPDKKIVGQSLKQRTEVFLAYVSSISQETIKGSTVDGCISVDFEDKTFKCQVKEKIVDCEFFVPCVIEPSFGISRILYALVEQSFKIRDGRTCLSIKPRLAFLHCMITYLRYSEEYKEVIAALRKSFVKHGIRYQINDRGCSIGKKYSSCDEIGIPFFITLDQETLASKTVTIRDRDSTSQIRVNADEVASLLESLITEDKEWSFYYEKYGIAKNDQ
ncbi:glycyl-tRNA synthetase [Enteropsectra breve]|nr:glycyl-tRNA synthetase [Enteropsectra breve]